MLNEDQEAWAAFQQAGMLWAANRILSLIGWRLVVSMNLETKEVDRVFPERADVIVWDINRAIEKAKQYEQGQEAIWQNGHSSTT